MARTLPSSNAVHRLLLFGLATMLALAAITQVPTSIAPSGPQARVVVIAAPGQVTAAERLVSQLGGHVTRDLALIGGFSATLPITSAEFLSRQPVVRSITPDGSVHLLSDSYSPTSDVGSMYSTTAMTGARSLWSQGITGKGVDVALIDTGVAPVEGLAAPGKIFNGPDLSFEGGQANLRYMDTYGHGTHMAGIIAGRDSAAVSGAYAADSADFLGIAPDARILSVKVADAWGRTDVSQVIAALDWVVQHRRDNGLNVRIINLSFGTDSQQSYLIDPLAYAAEMAWKRGIVVVAAAGNDGKTSTGLADPAYDPYLIAVGAADTNRTLDTSDDTVAAFSNYGIGPRFPDFVAPGVHIQSLRVPGSFVDSHFSSTGYITSRFFRGSGTSQAAAVTTGGVALLLQQRPSLTPDQVKAVISGTARNLVQPANNQSQGHGELRLFEASHANVGPVVQSFRPATGTGSLDAARGSVEVENQGIELDGDWTGGSWTGGSWTGGSWTGGSWTGGSWTGGSWTGGSWTGGSWTSGSWTGGSWTGGSWTSGSWTTGSWTSGSWTSGSWTSGSWTSGSWTGAGWSSGSWT
jgi:serine protease AprX